VNDYLTTPYNLGTLKPEDRSVTSRYRSLVYASNNTEVAPDDISWKILGGGLESSAYDLAQFGWKVLSGSILTTPSLNTMWKAPVSGGVTYGLGWNYGITSGVKWVGKDGAQLGANTYLLMYPSKGIVVAVLSNKDGGGNNSAALARNIGNLMLANPSA
jgi:CubicO group peptidase (beta-lactamase class C family)